MIKYTQEQVPFSFDFSNHPVITSGDTLVNSTAGTIITLSPDTALSQVSISVDVANKTVSLVLKDGTANTTYEVRCTQPTTLGYKITERIEGLVVL
jgi:hypothetical protein